jgi:1,2-diacylglycerol-3-alpha-glucose alpha-1,2-galactosyltransferase
MLLEAINYIQFYGYLAAFLFLVILTIYITIKLISFSKNKKKSAEKLLYANDHVIRLHMVSETAYVTQGQGVHTAYIELMELLAHDKDVVIKVNGDGTGNIFHSHTYGPYYFWKGRNYKGRRILTAHVIPDSSKGTIPFWKQLLPLTTLYLKLAYSYADVVIAISPTVEQEIKRLGVKSKIVRIYNPVLLDNWVRTDENRKKGRKQLGIKDHEKLVLGVGQLQERKGVEDFIDMATAIPGAKFVWVGGRPWGVFTEGIKRINDRIENAPSNISFTGLLDLKEMRPMYAAADVFLFPSYQENCPLAPLEAAAAGLPVVFRDIPEYTSLYSNPYLKAANTTEFIETTRKLLSDNSFYTTGVKMSAELISEFDKFKIKKDIINLYTGVLTNYFKN